MKVALVVLVCVVVGPSGIRASDYFSKLSNEIKELWEYIWSYVKQALKRPTRVPRVDLQNRTAVKTAVTTLQPLAAITDANDKGTTNKTNEDLLLLRYFTKHKQPVLPVFAKPKWRARKECNQQQPLLELLLGREGLTSMPENQGISTVDISNVCGGRRCISARSIPEKLQRRWTTAEQHNNDIANDDDIEQDKDIGVLMFI